MIETKEKVIDGSVYSVTQLPARRALRLKSKIIKLFGPTITQLILSSQDPDTSKIRDPEQDGEECFKEISEYDKARIREIQKSSVVKAIQILSSSIDEKTFDDLVVEITQGVRRDGVELLPQTIDNYFSGSLLSLYHLIWFVLEVNYADFLGLKDIGSQFSNPLKKETDTKKTYTFKSQKSS